MKQYILKEYGSWSVMIISFLAGLFTSTGAGPGVVVVFIALTLLVNSKQAFTRWRASSLRRPLIVFLTQVCAASAMLIALFGGATVKLLPFLTVPAVYLLFNIFSGEHYILTEMAGFALLSLSGLIAKFSVTGVIDSRLYVATALFFMAGVFKIKARFKKRPLDRVLAALYVAVAAVAYFGMNISLLVLTPLIDNLLFAVTLYPAKLKVTGWIEVAKGVLFLAFLAVFYH